MQTSMYDHVSSLLQCNTHDGMVPPVCFIASLKVALRLGNYQLIKLLLRFGANVNYYCRVNTTHFPSALQYALKDEVNCCHGRRQLSLLKDNIVDCVCFRWSSGCCVTTATMCTDASIVPMATAPTFPKATRAGATRSLKTP